MVESKKYSVKKISLNLLAIILLIFYGILPFLKICNYTALLPGRDADGNDITGTFIYSFSVFENFGMTPKFVHIIVFAIFGIVLLFALVIFVIDLFKEVKIKKWRVFYVSSIVFMLIMLTGYLLGCSHTW